MGALYQSNNDIVSDPITILKTQILSYITFFDAYSKYKIIFLSVAPAVELFDFKIFIYFLQGKIMSRVLGARSPTVLLPRRK